MIISGYTVHFWGCSVQSLNVLDTLIYGQLYTQISTELVYNLFVEHEQSRVKQIRVRFSFTYIQIWPCTIDSESPPHLHAPWGPLGQKKTNLKRSVSSPVAPKRLIIRKCDKRLSTVEGPLPRATNGVAKRNDLKVDSLFTDSSEDEEANYRRLPLLEMASLFGKVPGKTLIQGWVGFLSVNFLIKLPS